MENYGYQGNNTQTLAGWKVIPLNGAATHDANSQLVSISSMGLTSDGHLQTGSPAIGKGANLTSLCTGGAINALCLDKVGNPRPTTGSWDLGAYASSTVGNQPPAAPTQLNATVN